jgi:clan AA aspartic protease (TIGR02281 family)
MNGSHRMLVRNLIALAILAAVLAPTVNAENLSEQLQGMAKNYDFELTLQTDLTEEPARRVNGSLVKRLDILLADFNHVITGAVDEEVERVIVLSRKQPLPPPSDETVLKVQRQGMHHLVSAILVGSNGAQIPSRLILDTGATFVVLPRSQASALGIAPDELEDRQVQTANGKVAAGVGRIPLVRIGDEEIADIQVAFIDDSKLGGKALLGMSALGRYKLILDNEKNTLTLIPDE